ncbi:MAG: SMC-Scp complex subunit ScpB [Dehalococcoidia bacterium]|jgi:segregation and condensation protein B
MTRIRRPPSDKVKQAVESLLFVAQEPVDVAVLARSLHLTEKEVLAAIESLAEDCRERGVRIQTSGNLVQMATAPDAARYVENFLNMDHHTRLSTAGLETLAIVAYRQPITRAGIEAIRGVNSDGAVATLLARDLIEETGRARTPGRPALLGTTVRFLEHFGLEKPSDLPPLPTEEEPDEVRLR